MIVHVCAGIRSQVEMQRRIEGERERVTERCIRLQGRTGREREDHIESAFSHDQSGSCDQIMRGLSCFWFHIGNGSEAACTGERCSSSARFR